MEEHEWIEHRDDGYRALGRYFAEFSSLVEIMSRGISDHLKSCGVSSKIPPLILGAAPAEGIATSFFAVAQVVHEHDEEELRVARELKKQVLSEIPFRNDAAHGDWIIGGVGPKAGARVAQQGPLEPKPPFAIRHKPGRQKGSTVIVRDDLDARSDDLQQLAYFASLYGTACFRSDGHPIQDLVRFDSRGKLIEGPVRTRVRRAIEQD